MFDANLVTDTLGAQSQIDLFLVRLKSDGTGYDFIDPANIFTSPTYPASPDLPVVASPTRANALFYSLQLLSDHKPSFDDKGIPSIDGIDNYDSGEQFANAIVKIGLPGGISTRKRSEYFLENTVKRGGSISDDKMILALCYDQLDSVAGKVEITGLLGGIQLTSLGGHKNEEYVKPEFKIAGTTPEVNISIPAACFDANLVTVAGAETFYKSNLVYSKWHTAGANAI